MYALRYLKYKNCLAALIENALTEAECKELLRIAEASTIDPLAPSASPKWDRAMINMGGGRQALAVEERNCGRVILDTPEIADKLLARLRPFLRDLDMERLEDRRFVTGPGGNQKVFRLTRLNERLRFLKYVGGEYFRPHWDGMYKTPDGRERSYFTLHFYLNADGQQDWKELVRANTAEKRGAKVENPDADGKLLGGATSFLLPFVKEEEERHVRIFPKVGSVLVFQQRDLLHGGDSVFRGTKYTLRTDVMYEQE
ncbi:hypothetical protein ARAM_007145 [Aspergillus rambellii]|uniref:Prolyl 4-hydroxylase alpha subunit domain-containing protein n=1 Tax=Aspergillus rambellii TaxID=308745 RepID=A0A0F8WDP6_9EURO|nr:hypothetical protein ARAM_007145 [Aspergillus rambellii]